MPVSCRIFKETNTGSDALESSINEFFDEVELSAKEIVKINTVVEKVDGIDYITVLVFFEYTEDLPE